MMTTPTTAGEWLTEAIGEAEKLEKFRHGFPVGPLATPVDTTAVRAYLAALKTIVGIHSPMNVVHRVSAPDGSVSEHIEPWCNNCENNPWPCPTLTAVAAPFAGREGWARWFGDGA